MERLQRIISSKILRLPPPPTITLSWNVSQQQPHLLYSRNFCSSYDRFVLVRQQYTLQRKSFSTSDSSSSLRKFHKILFYPGKRPINSLEQTHNDQQKRCMVTFETFRRENSHVASAIRRMVQAAPDITLQVERINLVGCNNVLPYQLENCIGRSIVRIKVLTHVDIISEEALRHQLAYVEEQERLKFPPSSNKYPTAIIAVNLTGVEKQKELRLLQDCIFGASEVVQNNQVWVCGSPNSGKSSLILPLTKDRTMTVKNKKAYHLPKVSQRAGMTLGIKKHVMTSSPLSSMFASEVTLHDTPGLRPFLDDPRTPAALMFAARVTETFPNYQEICDNDRILQLQLEACNRHEILTKQYAYYIQEARKQRSSSSTPTKSKSASASQLQPPSQQQEQPEALRTNIIDEKNPLQHIRPAYVDLFKLKDGATNDPRVLRTAAHKVISSCTDKKIMTKFHQFDCGGCIFTPNHPYHSALINHAVNMRFHYGSPIIYMNDAAVRLVDVHHGRVTAFDPRSSKSYLHDDDGNDDDLDVEILEDFESNPRRASPK
jgi:50S ribosome-binding GTPase